MAWAGRLTTMVGFQVAELFPTEADSEKAVNAMADNAAGVVVCPGMKSAVPVVTVAAPEE
jgi:hypothetical protein